MTILTYLLPFLFHSNANEPTQIDGNGSIWELEKHVQDAGNTRFFLQSTQVDEIYMRRGIVSELESIHRE